MNTLPGTLWINRGRWNWRVKLPGESRRKNLPLRAPGQRVALSADKDRSMAESVAWRLWENATRTGIEAHDTCMTLDQVAGAFLSWAAEVYRRADGSPTREAANCEIALRPLRADAGRGPVDDVSYKTVLRVRDRLVESGLNRTTVNQRVGIWKRMFTWALENRHCAAATKAEVCAITNLKRNRSMAPEGDPVRPARHRDVKATLAHMPDNLAAMVRVGELSGMRPGELCELRAADIERHRSGVWVYRPRMHKNAHRDQCRVVCLGPRAQTILRPLMASKGCVFSPAKASLERFGRGAGSNQWTTSNYGQAVRYAIRAARKAGAQVEDWTPNQLRHACGTRVRRKCGPDAARAVLGHSTGARITDRYTADAIEREMIAAASVPMLKVG